MSPVLEMTRDGILSALRWHPPALAEAAEQSYRRAVASRRLDIAPQAQGRQTGEDDFDDRAGR